MSTYDAIVIGGGHNGLVAALYLVREGWRVVVLERNPQVGGAIASGEITLPGFIHDLYSTNQNLFMTSQAYRDFKADLQRHGLRYRISDRPYSNVYPGGKSLRVYQDAEKTRAGLLAHDPADAAGWDRLYTQYQDFARWLMPAYAQAMPSLAMAGTLANAVRGLGVQRVQELAQIILSSTRELGQAAFASPEARALAACWGMHLDFGPDVSGGAMFPFLEVFGDMEAGMAIVEGGAARMPEALAGLVREYGGEVRTEAEVTRVLVQDGRAAGVELADGEILLARRAVVANLTPSVLFGRLLAEANGYGSLRQYAERYAYGPGTMMIHLALNGPVPWAAGEDLDQFAYVHIAPYVEDLARTYEQATNGYLPDSPFLVVGQTSAVDPTRAPAGQHVLWIQVRALPAVIRGDAASWISTPGWEDVKERYADRVLEKLEQYAPGVGERVLQRVVYSPLDLERWNPNLVGGDSVAGSHHLRQNFVWRPFPGYSNYRMPLHGLYMTGAATWPGAGTNAASGYLAAQEILHPHADRNKLMGAAGAAAVLAGLGLARERKKRRLG